MLSSKVSNKFNILVANFCKRKTFNYTLLYLIVEPITHTKATQYAGVFVLISKETPELQLTTSMFLVKSYFIHTQL